MEKLHYVVSKSYMLILMTTNNIISVKNEMVK